MRTGLLSIAVAVVLSMFLPVTAAAQAPLPDARSNACDLFASTSGSDLAPGTAGAPLRTPQALTNRLQPGQTGCLRGGSYEGALWDAAGYREWTIDKPGIVVRSHPGERAAVLGRVYVTQEADHTVVMDLDLDGTNTKLLPSPTVDSTGAIFDGNDVTNHHTAICFLLGDRGFGQAQDVQILNNRIHGCGVLPAANHDHGIYLQWGVRTLIRGNQIFDNADRGIQLWPDAQQTTITGNVIAGNGQGLILSGDSATASSNTLVRFNIFAHANVRHNIESSWEGGPVGTGNVATNNCVWSIRTDHYNGKPANSGIQEAQIGFQAFGNLIEDPKITGFGGSSLSWDRKSRCGKLLARGASGKVKAKIVGRSGSKVKIKGSAASANRVTAVPVGKKNKKGKGAAVGPDGDFKMKIKAKGSKVRIVAPGMEPSKPLKF